MFRHQALRTETLNAISSWEAKNKDFGSLDSDSTKVDSPTAPSFRTLIGSEKGVQHVKSFESIKSPRKSHLYQMLALENALKWNPQPLQNFAAHKDFSGENISFLTHLSEWRKSWVQQNRNSSHKSLKAASEETLSPDNQLRERFNRALKLYVAFVSVEHAEFPVNVGSKTIKYLDSIFGSAADLLYGDSRSMRSSNNSVTPFADGPSTSKVELETGLQHRNSSSSASTFDPTSIWYWGDIPEDFSVEIFDEAEKEIKYLVLTNTWPKFVNAGYAEQVFDEEGRTLTRRMSQLFFWK